MNLHCKLYDVSCVSAIDKKQKTFPWTLVYVKAK